MKTQIVNASNAQEGKYTKRNKIFNPGLPLIGLSGTGPLLLITLAVTLFHENSLDEKYAKSNISCENVNVKRPICINKHLVSTEIVSSGTKQKATAV